MFSERLRWGWFALALVLSFGLPASMVYQHERTLDEGVAVKFRTRPVDPYDPFRGRYVQLAFDEDNVPLAEPAGEVERGTSVYVSVSVDENGYGSLEKAYSRRPSTGVYIKTKILYQAGDGTINVALPFDRYYMNERVAPEAERLYREANLTMPDQSQSEAFLDSNYALVRIHNGVAAIEGVYLENQPIEDYVRSKQAEK